MHQSHACHADSLARLPPAVNISERDGSSQKATHPKNHDYGNENTGSHSLEQNIGQRLKYRIRNKKYGQRGIVLVVGHIEILLETGKFGITNVGSDGGDVSDRKGLRE